MLGNQLFKYRQHRGWPFFMGRRGGSGSSGTGGLGVDFPASGDVDAASWVDRVRSNGGTVSYATQTAVTNFVVGCKADGIWAKFLRVNLFCGDQLAAAQVPLVATKGTSLETWINVVSGDYAEATGLAGNGGNKSVGTGISDPETGGGLALYLRSFTVLGITSSPIGAKNAAGTQYFRIDVNSDATWHAIYGGTASVATGSMSPGFFHTFRQSTTDLRLYRNGTQIGSTATTATTAANPASGINVLSSTQGGTPTNFSTCLAAGYFYHDATFSAADAANLYARIQAFQTALGRQV